MSSSDFLPPRGGYLMLLLAVLAAGGCGPGDAGPARYPVSGTVTLEGQPLASGAIHFVPTDAKQGALAAATVKDGKFGLTAEGGPAVGKHKVRVYADSQIQFDLDDVRAFDKQSTEEKAKAAQNEVSPEFNDATKLEATISATGPNEFHFEVKKRKAEPDDKKPAPRTFE